MPPSLFMLAFGVGSLLPNAGTSRPALDTVIMIDKCAEPREPVGHLRATGILRLRLSPDGRPDTASIEIGSSSGVTPAGLRSIAARQLAACRFRLQPKPTADLWVLQQLEIDSSSASIKPIPAGGRAFVALTWTPPPVPAEPLLATDTLLDERPRQLRCKRTSRARYSATTMVVRLPVNRQAAEAELQRLDDGEVAFTFVVGADGRFVPGSAVVLSSINPNATPDALEVYASCTYAPGRVAGVPIATRVAARLQSRTTIGP